MTANDQTRGAWLYPPELVDALAGFGLAPTSATPPVVVRDQLNDLYRYELRRMRTRLLAGEIPRPEYVDRVVALRKHFWPLTLPLAAWEKICAAKKQEAGPSGPA